MGNSGEFLPVSQGIPMCSGWQHCRQSRTESQRGKMNVSLNVSFCIAYYILLLETMLLQISINPP